MHGQDVEALCMAAGGGRAEVVVLRDGLHGQPPVQAMHCNARMSDPLALGPPQEGKAVDMATSQMFGGARAGRATHASRHVQKRERKEMSCRMSTEQLR